ncbi:MAG: anion transporter [Euryarchaeota archaeon]|nr:anion transporter [Euryarchaeota archaeon]
MADGALYLAAGVFVATYVLLSLRSVRGYRLDRPAVALFGGALMLAFGIVTPSDALAAINLDVLLLLLGMMLLVAGLDVCGFFDLVARKTIDYARTQVAFLALLMLATAVLSALVLNDTIVLLMTPIVIKTCRAMGINQVPFLVGEALAANIGSVATEVGNPQNAYVAIQSRIPFVEFTAVLLPVAAASLVVGFLATWLAFRRDLAKPVADPAAARKAIPVLVHRRGLALTITVVSATVVAFFLSTSAMLPFVALIGGSIVLLVLPAVARTTPRALFEKVDWSVLILFIGLFVLIEGVKTSGLLAELVRLFGGAGTGTVWGLSGIAAVLSNLVSNVPAVLLLAPTVVLAPAADQRGLWLALAASSTLAGNATIIGAAANIIVLQVASKAGAEVTFREFVKAGLPTSVATVAIAAAWLTIV